MSETLKTVLIILSTSVLYALSWTAARGAYLDGANNILVIVFTTFMRAMTLAGFCFYKGHKLFTTKQDFKIGFQSAIIQSISVIGILGSMAYIPGPVAITLLFTSTIMLLFFQWFKKEIEVNKWLFVTTATCLLGISMVVGLWGVDKSGEMVGYILIMMGAVGSASRLYVFGRLTKSRNPAVVGAETFLLSSLFLLLLLFHKLPILPHSLEGYGLVILGGVTSSIATLTMFYGIARVGAFHFSLYNKLEPVFGAIFSAILIGEILNLTQYIGMIIVIGSLVGYQLWDYQRKQKTP